jgi:SAM-dependent methyltransferase
MDAGQLALAAGRFDLVLCVEAAFLFESRRDFFDQARQLLRPGGWLVVSDLLFAPRAFGEALDWDWLVPAANRPLAAADYPELLRGCGLEPQRIEDATGACWQGFCRHLRRTAARAGAAADRHDFLDRLEASVSSYLLVAARAGAE